MDRDLRTVQSYKVRESGSKAKEINEALRGHLRYYPRQVFEESTFIQHLYIQEENKDK